MFVEHADISYHHQHALHLQQFQTVQEFQPALEFHPVEIFQQHPFSYTPYIDDSVTKSAQFNPTNTFDQIKDKHQRQLARLHAAIDTIEQSQCSVEQRLESRLSPDHANVYDNKMRLLADYRISLLQAIDDPLSTDKDDDIETLRSLPNTENMVVNEVTTTHRMQA